MAKILIVDDSTVQRTIIKRFLLKENHEIIGETKCGENVLELYKTLRPDIVLLDIVLPDANGIAILGQIMDYDNRYANVIMCSATALKNIIIETMQMGAKGFLVKPITADALLKTVNRVLQINNII